MVSVKEKYTTIELSSKDVTEKDKIVLSNDAYAVCQLLEALINTKR